MIIEKYIKYLLFNYDCVVIPDLGGFITSYAPADVHPVRHTFLPPSKAIAFNERLKTDDGLLVSTIAKFENFTTEEAYELVRGFVFDVRAQLKENNKCVIKEVGTLFINQEYALQFEADSKMNFENESFGLPELFYKPVLRETVTSRLNSTNPKDRPARTQTEHHTRRTNSNAWVYFVSIPVVALVAFSVYFVAFTDGSQQSLSSLNPFQAKTQPVATTEPAEDTTVSEENTAENSVATESSEPVAESNPAPAVISSSSEVVIPKAPDHHTVNAHNTVAHNETPAKKQTAITPAAKPVIPAAVASAHEQPMLEAEGVAKASADSKKYYVIVGSFSQVENANQMRDRLLTSDARAKIIEPSGRKGLYKVSVADFTNLSEAQAKISELQPKYKESLWVCKY